MDSGNERHFPSSYDNRDGGGGGRADVIKNIPREEKSEFESEMI